VSDIGQRKIRFEINAPILLASLSIEDRMTNTNTAANTAATATTSCTTAPTTTVDLNNFCDTAKSITGQSPASEFGALDEYVDGSLQTVAWSITGSNKAVKGAQYDKATDLFTRYLHIRATTKVGATCGRCLNAMVLDLTVDAQLQVFQTDAAADAAAMTPDADAKPDPIVTSRNFDLLDQVQEELLLNMPDNPMHHEGDAACMLPVTVSNVQASPFASLAALSGLKK
jgi:uncharacterized protein